MKNIILYENLDDVQKELADKLLEELLDTCGEVEDYTDVEILGLDLTDDSNKKLILSFVYDKPDGNDTIFCKF